MSKWPASLDRRLAEGLKKMGFSSPLSIQSAVLAEALEGRDCLIQSPTGSGKSLAYLIPLVQCLLKRFDESDGRRAVSGLSGLVLVPSKDLALQTAAVLNALTVKCFTAVISDSFTGGKYRRHDLPSILVTTPSLLLSLLTDRSIAVLPDLAFLAIDEADLIFSFGFELSLRQIIANHLPSAFQCLLVSATLSADVQQLAGLCLHSPRVIAAEGAAAGAAGSAAAGSGAVSPARLREFVQRVSGFSDKLLVLFGLVRLEIVSGKILVFTNTIHDAYRLKLVFQQFGIAALVLHAELPATVRHDIATAFNQQVVSVLFVADSDSDEGSLHRGIDFLDVAVVVNFDASADAVGHTHRVGRTARGLKEGVAITLLQEGVDAHSQLERLPLEMAELEGLRYRVDDVLKSAGNSKKVKLARQRELFQQILSSNKLKNTITENEHDAKALRRAVKLNHTKSAAHLKHLPAYLIPAEIAAIGGSGENAAAASGNPVVQAARQAADKTSGDGAGTPAAGGTGGVNQNVTGSFERKNFAEKSRSLRDKLLSRNEKKAADADDLPPISGRKLWKIKHKKALKKSRVDAGKHVRARQAVRMKKIAKRFQ